MISIIVPIYNVEKYLEKCLDSLIYQTYRNIEIICVNDGSTDNSLEILKTYKQKDNRIKIINKKNGGLSNARNCGLKLVNGQYIMFVDSDDWIDLETCQKSLDMMIKYSVDVVMWSYIREYENRSLPKIIFDKEIYFDEKETRKKLYRRLFGLYGKELMKPENADAIVTVWGKLYKSNLILNNDIKFVDTKEIGTCEDGLFNIEVFQNIKSVYYLKDCFYHYRKATTSFTSSYRIDLYKKWKTLYDMMGNHINKNNLDDSFKSALSNRIALSVIGLGLNTMYSNQSNIEKYNELKCIVNDLRMDVAVKKLDLKYFPIHWKMFFYFLKKKLIILIYLMLILMNRVKGI